MEVTWTTLLIVCPLVFLSGLVDAVAGGGGLISLPAYLLAGLPPHAATATNKCGSVFGTGLSTLRFLKNGRVRLGPAAVSAATALLGSVLGARLCLLVPDTFLHYFLVAALPVLAVFLLLKRDFGLENKADALSGPLLMLLSGLIGLVLGLYDGFFGPAPEPSSSWPSPPCATSTWSPPPATPRWSTSAPIWPPSSPLPWPVRSSGPWASPPPSAAFWATLQAPAWP